jgi:AcrR family transcriptional regulator
MAEVDHRRGPRRRGMALETAILEAALAELSERGYAELSLERVASRAGTGNASVYRRWRTRAELVVDTMRHAIPDHAEEPDTGDVRSDVLTVLRRMVTHLAGPFGEAVRGLVTETMRHPELTEAARARLLDTRQQLMLDILSRGAERGQVRPEAVTAQVAAVGPALLVNYFMLRGLPLPDDLLTSIVDEVVLPLVTLR